MPGLSASKSGSGPRDHPRPDPIRVGGLSTTHFPGLEKHDWSKAESLYKALSEEYDVTISIMDHTIKPVALTETEALKEVARQNHA